MNTSIATAIAVNMNTITNIIMTIAMMTVAVVTTIIADAMTTTAAAAIPAHATAEKTVMRLKKSLSPSEYAPAFLP